MMRTGFVAVVHPLLMALAVALATLLARPAAAQCPGDVVPTGAVNGTDLAELLAAWGPCAGCAADVSGDGVVDGGDLAVLLGGWGPCAPVVSGVTPNVGTIVGGTPITISGAYFTGVSSVLLGGAPATQVTVVNSTTLTAVTPAASAGAVDVTVTANGRVGSLANAYSYSNSSITGVVPSVGAAQGGGAVVITGAFLANTSAVWFGDSPAQSFTQVSATKVNAVPPAGTAGTSVDVRLQTPAGLLVAPAAYSYVSIVVPTWATLLEAAPDPTVVWDANLRAAIIATGLAWRVKDTATQIEMLLIPPGSFQMGCSPSSQFGCGSDESPVHTVSLTNSFYLGRYEVTQAQWQARMGSNPSNFQGGSPEVPVEQVPNRAVERVSWNMISGPGGFMSQTGMRLPTEAEWEYAYRAGTTTAFHGFTTQPNGTGDDASAVNVAWYISNSSSQTRPVGGKAANGFGLHDMAGNVWEWVNDWYSSSYYASSPGQNPPGPTIGTNRVIRGGSWNVVTSGVRASRRVFNTVGYTNFDIGFRVARTP
jgi:formylglycine-generating enzyme required for sulfatase activity